VLPSRTLALAWVVAVVLLPVVVPDPYVLRVAAMTCIFAGFAASWDLLAGYAGQVNFGHALFFGAGAYGSALLSLRLDFPPWIAVATGALIATAIGLCVGYLCLRLADRTCRSPRWRSRSSSSACSSPSRTSPAASWA